MINGSTVLAVIPARSGSKRCPNKNFLPFRGKTLYLWTLEAAQSSRYIDTVKLSLDKDRPPELSTDEAKSEDVLRYHLKETPHDWIVLLQPTSPLRTTEDIDACIERAQLSHGCISVGLKGKTDGGVYVSTSGWIQDHDFTSIGLAKYYMDPSHGLDINEPSDFDL